MRANPFESQLERLARTLTDQFGVRVICQGDQAFTDGRQIVLPSLPEPMTGNPNSQQTPLMRLPARNLMQRNPGRVSPTRTPSGIRTNHRPIPDQPARDLP